MKNKYIRNRHLHLLVFMIAVLLVFPLVEQFMPRGVLLVSLIFFAGLLTALRTLDLPKRTFLLYASLAAAILVLEVALRMMPQGSARFDTALASWILYAVFMAGCIIAMLGRVARSGHVTFDVIIGGINVYLLIAFLWVVIYRIIIMIDPGAFRTSGALGITRIIYFSYSTISTLGMGDMIPVNRYAMIMTGLEAILGQIYIALFISLLVGLYIFGRRRHGD